MAEDDYVPVPVKDGELPAGNPANYSAATIISMVNGANSGAPNQTRQSYVNVGLALGDTQGGLRKSAGTLTEAWRGPSAELVQGHLRQLYESADTLISASVQFALALDKVTEAVDRGKARVPDAPLSPIITTLLPEAAKNETRQNREALKALNTDLHNAYLDIPSDIYLNLPPDDDTDRKPPLQDSPGASKGTGGPGDGNGFGPGGSGSDGPGGNGPGGNGPGGNGPGGNGPGNGPGGNGPGGNGPGGLGPGGLGPGGSGPGVGPGGVITPNGAGTAGPNGTDLAGAAPGPGPGGDPFGLPGGPGSGPFPGPGSGPNGSPFGGNGFAPGFGPGAGNGPGSGRQRSFNFAGEMPPGGMGGVPRTGGAFGVIGAEAAEQRAAALAARGNRTMGMPMGMLGGMGGAGSGRDGQEHERTTWLSEDEEVWGSDDDVAPPVIG